MACLNSGRCLLVQPLCSLIGLRYILLLLYAAILGDMSSRHYFVDLDQEPYTYNEEYKAATQLAIGQLYRVKLDAEKKTVLTNLKESEAIRGGLTVISNTIRLQINSLECPLLGSAVTGPAARDSVGRLSSALDTANRLRFVAESYHSIRITKFRALDRKLAATKAYISAAQIYLQRAERPLGPYQTFTPPQTLPEGVFTGTAFIAADFRELEYHHLQAVVDKYDQTVPATPHFKSPEDLAICHRCRGPPGHRDHLYQTERDVIDHVRVLFLQYVLSAATGGELAASYHLQTTVQHLGPIGNTLNARTRSYLQICNDLHAIYEGVNAETPSQDLGTTHIDGYPIPTVPGPYHAGSLSLATDTLGHALRDPFAVTRHEYVLAGDLETRISKNDTLQLTIMKQLRAVRDNNLDFVDYDPIVRLPKTERGVDVASIDVELKGLRDSFISLLDYLK